MTATPLSDLMTEHTDTSSAETYNRFLTLFAESVVGIVGIGPAKHDAQGQSVTVAGFGAGRTTYGDGQARILAFADPDVASRTPGSQCTAGLPGEVLLQMAVADPDCTGILVNCATRPISLVINKQTAEWSLANTRRP
jgi:hypothetical protein